jgi:hypothetical protein
MSDPKDDGATADQGVQRWLEVEDAPGGKKTVHCPRQAQDMPLHECLGCARYKTLALDPSGQHVYIDCDWAGPK